MLEHHVCSRNPERTREGGANLLVEGSEVGFAFLSRDGNSQQQPRLHRHSSIFNRKLLSIC